MNTLLTATVAMLLSLQLQAQPHTARRTADNLAALLHRNYPMSSYTIKTHIKDKYSLRYNASVQGSREQYRRLIEAAYDSLAHIPSLHTAMEKQDDGNEFNGKYVIKIRPETGASEEYLVFKFNRNQIAMKYYLSYVPDKVNGMDDGTAPIESQLQRTREEDVRQFTDIYDRLKNKKDAITIDTTFVMRNEESHAWRSIRSKDDPCLTEAEIVKTPCPASEYRTLETTVHALTPNGQVQVNEQLYEGRDVLLAFMVMTDGRFMIYQFWHQDHTLYMMKCRGTEPGSIVVPHFNTAVFGR